MRVVGLVALASCAGEPPVAATGAPAVTDVFPLPDDLDTIDWVTVFQDALTLTATVTAQAPWLGHVSALDDRVEGCPDLWVGPFTVGAQEVAGEEGVAWNDDCVLEDGSYYDGWVGWETTIVQTGDASTVEGRTSDASRTLEGDAIVGDVDGVRFEFDGTATDSLYELDAYGFERFTYSTTVDGTVTGSDVFEGSLTPDGFRTDLFLYLTGGDLDTFEARGNVYLFTPQLHDRFDSVQVDMALVGPEAAGPGDCALEPLGWIGVRDTDALWYDVVFLPRSEEDVSEVDYEDEIRSACDGCGRLYVQGIEQPDTDVCVDFTFVFDGGFPLPDPADYVLPIQAL